MSRCFVGGKYVFILNSEEGTRRFCGGENPVKYIYDYF
jgi:hypothetical protein